MSAAAPTLFKPPPALGDLTPRQRFTYDLLARPRTDEEVGVWLHAARGVMFGEAARCTCNDDRPCIYAADNGRAVLVALRNRELVVRRRVTGCWERTDGSSRYEGPGEVIPF